jgi:hypothetical protein
MRIDWRNHLINFVLVVLSILLAFQLERCGSNAREDRLVAAHLAEIVEETEFNQKRITETLANMEESGKQLDTLLDLIHTTDRVAEINQRMFRAMQVPGIYLKQTAYNSFVETGDIRFLDDFEQKAELVSLYEYYAIAELYGELLGDTYQNGFFDYINAELDLYRARPAPIEVYRERSFVNAMSSIRYFLRRAVAILQRDRERMAGFIERYN